MSMLPALMRDGAGLIGAGLVAYGSWLIYEPAGFVVGGLMMIGWAALAARNG